MGLLKRLLLTLGWPSVASSPEYFASTSEALEYSITKLRIGLFSQLYRAYSSRYGDETKFICGAILNEALAEEPSNDAAKQLLDARCSVPR
jgi:hypothetical protein